MTTELLEALEALVNAVAAERKAEDTLIQAEGTARYKAAQEAYQDASATTIIKENEARAIIKKARGN